MLFHFQIFRTPSQRRMDAFGMPVNLSFIDTDEDFEFCGNGIDFDHNERDSRIGSDEEVWTDSEDGEEEAAVLDEDETYRPEHNPFGGAADRSIATDWGKIAASLVKNEMKKARMRQISEEMVRFHIFHIFTIYYRVSEAGMQLSFKFKKSQKFRKVLKNKNFCFHIV